MYKEFRSIWSTLEAVATIPRSSRTTKSEHYIHSLSLARFIVFFLTCVVRAAIASILLMAGINWLARTSSIEELMLNAVALNGIMDVDELLFAAFTPLSIQHQLQRLRPVKMKYTSGRSQRESVVLFFLLLATVLIPYFVLLQPLGDGMLEIKKDGWTVLQLLESSVSGLADWWTATDVAPMSPPGPDRRLPGPTSGSLERISPPRHPRDTSDTHETGRGFHSQFLEIVLAWGSGVPRPTSRLEVQVGSHPAVTSQTAGPLVSWPGWGAAAGALLGGVQGCLGKRRVIAMALSFTDCQR